MRRTAVLGCALSLLSGGGAYAVHLAIDTEGHTTLEQILTGDRGANYSPLSVQAVNETYIPRAPASAPPQAGRHLRRQSLAYFSQLTDFQIADEESPARVEFLDPGASSAWRPHEAFHPFVIDASIRQVNRFAPSSPVPDGNGNGAAMDFALLTGDQIDNQQRNEMEWMLNLMEGNGPSDFGSGVEDPAFYDPANPDFTGKASCPAFLTQEGGSAAAAAAEGAAYTGVQDQDDYPAGAVPPQPAYYDPDVDFTSGPYVDWPVWSGLMDRAQTLSFTPTGLAVPSYWSNGNHDALMQGNEDANAAFEDIATACFKALGTTQALPPSGSNFPPDPNALLFPAAVGMLVPPDPNRQIVSKQQIKAVIGANDVDNDHGFDFVDDEPVGVDGTPDEEAESNGSASYYAWDPPQTPGIRFINIDTVSEGGQTAEGVGSGSASGNIDDPQFEWLRGELDAAQDDGKLIVIFGHHPVRSMDTEIADEQAAPPCAGQPDDGHGHPLNPGCDPDPRSSLPIHLGQDPAPGDPRESFVELLDGYSNVIAYVAGHTHEHRLVPFTRSDQTVWWEINTSATSDWPQQHRLVEVMDNRDGTLSIFGTVLDAASPATAPGGGDASGFDKDQLASIGRTLSFNDPQNDFSGEGTPNDRNVEMLLPDPRASADVSVVKTAAPTSISVGEQITYAIRATNNSDSVPAGGVRVTDLLPNGFRLNGASAPQSCSGPATRVVCGLGTLAPGASATATITVTADVSGTILNSATALSSTPDLIPANNTDTASVQIRSNGADGSCGDRTATITGTPGDDRLEGTPGDDVIDGGAGNDKILGGEGDDLICGGDGDDKLLGNKDEDRLLGDDGDDTLKGGDDPDILKGNEGEDALKGGKADDRLFGGKDGDLFRGDGGDRDFCRGNPKKDKIESSCEIVPIELRLVR